MVYILVMIITAYEKSDNYVVTFSSLKSSSLRSHDELIGDGSSGRSSYVSRRRAFQRGSAIIYCNRDKLTTFLTLTYAKQHQDYNIIINDLKNYFSKKHISYLAVVEKHKSGNYHVHLITSELNNVVSLRKGKYSWGDWKKGFSDVKFLSGTDDKFRIEKYIFKYMTKSEKIGGRYFLKSRDLTVNRYSYPYGFLPKPLIDNRAIDFSEKRVYNVGEYYLSVERQYYGKHSNQY